MIPVTLVDTGPLVAFLVSNDQHHKTAVDLFKQISGPLHICEPVLTETCFLVARFPRAIEEIGRWLNSGAVKLLSTVEKNHREVFSLMKKYQDHPMSLADAYLVTLTSHRPESRVLTFNHHFQIYRTVQRRKIKTLGLE